MKKKSPEEQLAGFIAKYTDEIGDQARAVLDKMRALLPGAVEMVYDNYNALVVGFGATDRPSEAIISVVLFPRWVSICFIQGAKLPDPRGRLSGSGKQVRCIRLECAETLDEPAVRELIALAQEASPKPFDKTADRRMIIKSISAKQRPRRITQAVMTKKSRAKK
jgi:hypothetical protein